jgi:hypothetical protein
MREDVTSFQSFFRHLRVGGGPSPEAAVEEMGSRFRGNDETGNQSDVITLEATDFPELVEGHFFWLNYRRRKGLRQA